MYTSIIHHVTSLSTKSFNFSLSEGSNLFFTIIYLLTSLLLILTFLYFFYSYILFIPVHNSQNSTYSSFKHFFSYFLRINLYFFLFMLYATSDNFNTTSLIYLLLSYFPTYQAFPFTHTSYLYFKCSFYLCNFSFLPYSTMTAFRFFIMITSLCIYIILIVILLYCMFLLSLHVLTFMVGFILQLLDPTSLLFRQLLNG